MFETLVDLDVHSTPTAAFDHIARGFFDHHGIWDPSVTSMVKTSDGPVGPGTTGREGRRFGPWSIASEFRVTEFEPSRRFAFRTTKGPMIEDVKWTIDDRPDGATVRMHLRLIPAALALRLLEPVMRPVLARNARSNAARMKAALDALT